MPCLTAHAQTIPAHLFPPVDKTFISTEEQINTPFGDSVLANTLGPGRITSSCNAASACIYRMESGRDWAHIGLIRLLDVSHLAGKWLDFTVTGSLLSGDIIANFTVIAVGSDGRKGPIPERIVHGRSFICNGRKPCERHAIVHVSPGIRELQLGFYITGAGSAEVQDISIREIAEPDVPPLSSASGLIDEAIDLLAKNSLRPERDWASIRTEALKHLPQNPSDLDAYGVIGRLVMGLEDNHSKLIIANEPLFKVATRAESPEKSPHEVEVEDGIGVIRLSTFGSEDQSVVDREASDLRLALVAASRSVRRGWLVDLREFQGGGNWAYTAGLCPLLRGPDVGGFRNQSGELTTMWRDEKGAGTQLNGKRAQLARVRSRNQRMPNANLPVAILVGPKTASAGEAVAAEFIGASRVTVLGQPTAGLSTGVEPFKLNADATLAIAGGYVVTRTGKEFRSGILPDRMVDDPSVESAARDWISHAAP